MIEWQRLVATTILDYAHNMVAELEHRRKLFHYFAGRHTTQQIEEYEAKMRKEREAETARLAAIEAAKSPAQKLREKQEACDHVFVKKEGFRYPRCTVCDLHVHPEFAMGYVAGHDNGYEAGYRERGQHDTDEE